ncbi:hypothetical protein ACFWV1_00105 [Streptomyces sp. NPDC058700]|uniref:hypothetical protein n=1 Tax=unclassified Streptomyces TaxID=2593676 RepID=UPI003647FED5
MSPFGMPVPGLTELEERVGRKAVAEESTHEWEYVRELSVGRMQSSRYTTEERLRWGHLALAVLSKEYAQEAHSRIISGSELARVRAYMIHEFGASDSDAARQPALLCSYVLENIDMTRAEAASMAEDWRSRPREQLLHLRRIKNMLAPLATVQHLLGADDPLRQEGEAWLALVPKLP